MRTRAPEKQQAREEMGRGQTPSTGMDMGTGGVQNKRQWPRRAEESTASNTLPRPDSLAAAALDETAGMLLETGLMPRYLDWGEGVAGGGLGDEGRWRVGGGAGDEMRRQGKRGDGEWDWQALRRGVVDERGDVAFYDGSFVEDPWRGLGGARGEGR